jgi:hypothetical protein
MWGSGLLRSGVRVVRVYKSKAQATILTCHGWMYEYCAGS